MQVIPTILCGGAGSRLWPVSRELYPKPFIRLNDGQSLLQKAFQRGALLDDVSEVLTVTNLDLYFQTTDEFRKVNHGKTKTSYILEPFGRNTAGAIASAALYINKQYGKDAIMLVLAADHLITDQAAFQRAVHAATKLAEQNKLVTFGIKPNAPETGYGYIEASGNSVIRFIEKPPLDKAQEYVDSGQFFWNSGMFCFSVQTILQQLEEHCPETLSAAIACIDCSIFSEGSDFTRLDLDPNTFSQVPDNSIDYAVMEKSNHVAVVPCDIGWSDIGSWSALGDLTTPDANGNRIASKVELRDVSNCYIQSEERLVGAIGIQNLIIIDTPDALLVAERDRVQEVKHLYASLKNKKDEIHKLHRTVHRPWGTYTVLEEGTNFKIKRIEVKPGASLSLQMHHHRSEHWVVVRGQAHVVNGDQEITINTNESTFIPAGHKHRLHNSTTLPCVIIEVQSGDYVGEDDIVRFEDVYGRAGELRN